MAIYHLSVRVISRASGRSATAAAAYRAGARIADARTGLAHDYRARRDVAHAEILLPAAAPERLRDRASLWNAVEQAERAGNARLARELVVALPRELDAAERLALVRAYVAEQFVARGMCADVCVHDDGGANPHAHVMLTMRQVAPDGSFAAKSSKEYLVRHPLHGERHMAAHEAREAQAQGWNKVYEYRRGRERRRLTEAEAAAWPGCSRVGRDPVARKVSATDWDEQENVERWRAAWADAANDALARAGSAARVDHRSHARRGLDELPTVHLGPAASALEARGVRTERGDVNREARRHNALLAQIAAAVADLVRRLARARALERARTRSRGLGR